MKKHMRTTLGRKLLAFYLVFLAISFFGMSTLGHSYIDERVHAEAEGLLRDIGITLVSSHINQQRHTDTSIEKLESLLNAAAEASECRILIISNEGDVIIDTHSDSPKYNVYQGDARFLRHQTTSNFTMDGYLESESLCVCLQMEENPYLNGYMVLAQTNLNINIRTTYYTNILTTFFFLMMFITAIFFVLIYLFNVRPLHKLRNGAKDFSISRDNPPIIIHSNDEYGELAQTLNVIGAELSKFDEYQRRFLSNISHDFRSPLTNIRGYVEAILDGLIPVNNQEKYLRIILNETQRLTKLTDSLLSLNQYDKDNIMLSTSEFDIHTEIQNTIDSLEDSTRSKNVHINFTKQSEEPLLVVADRDKILQVLHNLLDNAIKFSSNDSDILVTTRLKHDRVFISVKDSGIGIPKDELPKIWERFYKTDLSRGKDRLGTGLGLPICKEIINAHKQTINVVSTVGVGSQFTFTLPKA